MKTKKRILVALDLEEQAVIALKYAEHFAKLLDYEIDIVTVVEENSFIRKLFSDENIKEQIITDVDNKIKSILVKHKTAIDTNKVILFGKPYEKIVEYAKSTNPSMVFMGKSEMPKYKRAFLGSNSLHVLLETDFPIVTIRGNYDFEKYTNSHKEIMVPLDLNKDVSEQISASVELAKLMHTSLYLYSVEQKGSKGEHTKMLSSLAKLKKSVTDLGVQCRIDLVQNQEKDLHELINEAAININASLIVIMKREESKFAEFILGTHANDIISNSEIPVMSIEPWDTQEGSVVFSKVIDVLGVFKKK